MSTARIPERIIEPSGWGWCWTVTPYGPRASYSGHALTRWGANRKSARCVALELDRYHKFVNG